MGLMEGIIRVQWSVIDAQLQEGEPVLRQGIVRLQETNVGIGQSPAHITDGRPVSFREVREKPHGLHNRRPARGAERCRAAIRPIQPLSIFEVGRAVASDLCIEAADVEQVNAQRRRRARASAGD